MRRHLAGVLAVLSIAFASAAAQAPATDPVAVFLDCGFFCDQDFIKTEITYVSWVRDRAVSDVHILLTQQGTGGGGTEYTLAFLGQRASAGKSDTIRFLTGQSATSDNIRRAMTRTIKLGLVRFVANSAIAERLNLTLSAVTAGAAPAAASKRDPWNLWVFSVGANGNVNGERTSEFNSISGNVGARRTTERWKVNLNARENYRESKFDFGGTKSLFIQRTYSFTQLAVKSLGPRTAAGIRGSVGSTTYENKRLYWRFTPAVEFDVFPYSESTRRMLTVQYAVGAEHFTYKTETIYFKFKETRPLHSLSVNLSQTQPWGSVNVGLEGGQYLDETNRNYGSVFAGTGLRLFKGFNVNFSGSFSSIHNQLYLARSGATPEEVLLQQRRLQTNYSYFFFTGISYTFGSVFNSIVNPRFGRSGDGGGTVFFF
jgi:hypothetical protein